MSPARTAVISFVMGQPRYREAVARWVHSLRDWFSFDGDIILFVDAKTDLPIELRRQVEIRSLAKVQKEVAELRSFTRHWDGRGRTFIHKPFVLREALEKCSADVVFMSDIDALAVKSLEPMFEQCVVHGKVMVPRDFLFKKSIHSSVHQRGFFTKSERDQADVMGMEPVCAGFVMGPVDRMRVTVERWIEVLTTRRYQRDGKGGLEEQSALNFILFENPDWWVPMPGWVTSYVQAHGVDGPYWGWPSPSTRIWHFYGAANCLEAQRHVFNLRNAGKVSW